MKTLIMGGVRSGKSRYAGELARVAARPVTLIATGCAGDAEMTARIAAHRAERPAEWRLVEEPVCLAAALHTAAAPAGVVIVDCLTLWLSNLLCGGDEEAIGRETRALIDTLPRLDGELIMIANEVGLGIVPVSALARRFTDEAGALHQRLAALCDRVVLMVAGLPLAVRAPR